MRYIIFKNLTRWEISTSTDFRLIALLIASFKSIFNREVAVADLEAGEIIFERKSRKAADSMNPVKEPCSQCGLIQSLWWNYKKMAG